MVSLSFSVVLGDMCLIPLSHGDSYPASPLGLLTSSKTIPDSLQHGEGGHRREGATPAWPLAALGMANVLWSSRTQQALWENGGSELPAVACPSPWPASVENLGKGIFSLGGKQPPHTNPFPTGSSPRI